MRILHLYFGTQDNLGDKLCGEAVQRSLTDAGLAAEFDNLDFFDMHYADTEKFKGPLDAHLESIHRSYDAVVLGAGGMLDPQIAQLIFRKSASWKALSLPFAILGVGVRANWGAAAFPDSFMGEPFYASPEEMVRSSRAIAVRDFASARAVESWGKTAPVVGCPTLRYAKVEKSSDRNRVLVNLPFRHGVTAQYQQPMLDLTKCLLEKYPNLLWVCHSMDEEREVRQIEQHIQQKIDFVRPTTFDQVQQVYSSGRFSLVTKAHAAWFCAANAVPFAFLSYDMKCDALLELYDLPVEDFSMRIDLATVEGLEKILNRLEGEHESLRTKIEAKTRQLIQRQISEATSWAKALCSEAG